MCGYIDVYNNEKREFEPKCISEKYLKVPIGQIYYNFVDFKSSFVSFLKKIKRNSRNFIFLKKKKKSKTLWKFSILLKNKSFVQNSLEFFTVLEINFLLQNNHGISHHQKEIFRKLVSLENKSSRTIFINQKPLFSKGKLH